MGDSTSDVPGTQASTAREDAQPKHDVTEQARRFLAAEEVKKGSREKKVEFLASKGISAENIDKLLAEQEQEETAKDAPSPPRTSPSSGTPAAGPTTSPLPPSMPPIVTYPEFLATPQKPPPLITVPRLLNTLYATATAGIALYGTGKFVINPMVETLTAARESLASTADQKLDQLVTKLEGVVSVVPPPKGGTVDSKRRRRRGGEGDGDSDFEDDDAFSEASDPTELFHRDIGTQTSSSIPSSPAQRHPSLPAKKTPTESQTDRVAKLTSSLRSLSEGISSQHEDAGQIHSLVELLREDLDKMTYPTPNDYSGSFAFYGVSGSSGGYRGAEPDDEIKQAREGIRRVKGVLLSARSFPASAR